MLVQSQAAQIIQQLTINGAGTNLNIAGSVHILIDAVQVINAGTKLI
jgi:hypothetical protein